MTQQTHHDAQAALSPQDLVTRMTAITSRLTEVVDLETSFIHGNKLLDVPDLQPEKIRLSNEYAMDVQTAVENNHLIDSAPAKDVSTLKTAISQLRERLDLNAKALAAACAVPQTLLNAVASAAAEHRAPTTGYGKDANLRSPGQRTTAALSLDEKI